MDLILGLTGVVGITGAGAYIAMLVFAPVMAASFAQFLKAVLDSRVGLALIALSAGLLGGDIYRATTDRAACAARVAATNALWKDQIAKASAKWAVARNNRDASVGNVIDAVVEKATADLKQQANQLQEQVRNYEATDPHPECVLTIDDVNRLRPPAPGGAHTTKSGRTLH